jgi:phosphoribosyl-ATP pyrophosphohydrolase
MKFEELFDLLIQKRNEDPEASTSAKYLHLGSHEIGKKVVEEAAESWMAVQFEGREKASAEIAQLLYWTALLAISADISLDEIERQL